MACSILSSTSMVPTVYSNLVANILSTKRLVESMDQLEGGIAMQKLRFPKLNHAANWPIREPGGERLRRRSPSGARKAILDGGQVFSTYSMAGRVAMISLADVWRSQGAKDIPKKNYRFIGFGPPFLGATNLTNEKMTDFRSSRQGSFFALKQLT